MRALLLDAERRSAEVRDIPVPEPLPGEVRIRVKALALNPVDALYMFHPLGATGRLMCSDFAGIIDMMGSSVPLNSGLRCESRVAGFLQGACSANVRPGAAAEYIVCPWDLVWHVKQDMRLQDASTISLCGLTAAQALFFRMGLPAPFPWPGMVKQARWPTRSMSVFIYGATTSVGLYAAQLVQRGAEKSGLKIKLFGAASPRHHPMLTAKPYSYDGLVDYRDADWPSRVRAFTDGIGVDYAYDCISEGSTVQHTDQTLSSVGQMAIVRSREGGAWTSAGASLTTEPSYGAVWEGLGEDVEYQGMPLPASREGRQFAVAFYSWLSTQAELQPNPIRQMPGGLDSIVKDGFSLLGDGAMHARDSGRTEAWMKPLSAEKMVYDVELNT